jgi:hypothetical protein
MTARNRTPALSGAAADMLTGTQGTDTLTIDLGGLDKSIELTGEMSLQELRDSLNSNISGDMNDPHFKKFTQDSAFMEEQVLVRVHPSTDKSATKIVEVWNNGTPQRFIRGQFVIARRKYVEVLARAKPFSVTTPEVVDHEGNRTTRIDTQAGLMYPFDMNDPNPMGQVWLQSVLQEA